MQINLKAYASTYTHYPSVTTRSASLIQHKRGAFFLQILAEMDFISIKSILNSLLHSTSLCHELYVDKSLQRVNVV
jgi:hypothetical protein